MTRLAVVDLRTEADVVPARQRTRQVAALFGFDGPDQVRLATAVSEVARHAVGQGAGGRAEFAADGRTLVVAVCGGRPAELPPALDGVRRLMDRFAIDPAGVIRLGKDLPRSVPAPDLPAVAAALARPDPADPLAEARRQNQELLTALADLRDREGRLADLNRELEETNRGVVALLAELEEKAAALGRAADLKARFLANTSHEFRTPLGSILGLCGLLLDRADGPLTPEQERQVGYVRRAAAGLAELVDDLLDLAQVEAGKTVVRAEPVAAAALLTALRGTMRPLATDPRVAFVVEADTAAGELVTDAGKVGQILRNFVSNALKFTARGEVRVTAAAGPGDTVVFAVADTGIGIAPADQHRVFEEFGQIDGPLQAVVKGTGLGLPLSRKLAELLGGRVGLTSVPGEGSVFTLTLPRTRRGPAADPVD